MGTMKPSSHCKTHFVILFIRLNFDKILFVDEALFDRDDNLLHADCRFGNGDIGIDCTWRVT
jgi:hypothetical protein